MNDLTVNTPDGPRRIEVPDHLLGMVGNAFLCRIKHGSGDDWMYDLAYNTVQLEGMEHIFAGTFGAATQIESWYILLKTSANDPFTTDRTYATPNITEVNAQISNATRPAWAVVAAYSVGEITYIDNDNSGANWATFNFIAAVTVAGLGVVGGGTTPNTKADTAGGGTLMSLANFASPHVMADAGVLEVMYRIGMMNIDVPTTTTTTAAPTTTTTTAAPTTTTTTTV